MTDWFSRSVKHTKRKRILAALAPGEREALDRFYNLGQDVRQISRDLGMTEHEFKELRARVKKAFLDADKPQ